MRDGRGIRHDDVDPGGGELDEREAGQKGGNRVHRRAEGGDEDAGEDHGHDKLDGKKDDAAEKALEAADSIEESGHGTERGRDGLRVAACRPGGTGGFVAVLLLVE